MSEQIRRCVGSIIFVPDRRRFGDLYVRIRTIIRLFLILAQKNPAVFYSGIFIIRKSKCSTDFKRNDFLKKTKRTHWVRFVHLNSLIESCVFLYLWNSPFDTFL